MRRIGARNPIAVRVFTILFIFIFAVGLIYYSVKIILNGSALAYDLGEKLSLDYEDKILKTYDDYLALIEKYGVKRDLSANNFSQNSYLASFQEYDACSESAYKTVKNVSVDNQISINFLVHNKCGWCKSHVLLYLVELDKIMEDLPINYSYEYEKELNCGTI